MYDLREYVECFLNAEGITLTELARKLGYKSRTSLVRIVEGSTRPEGVRDFERRMLERFDISAEGEAALHEATAIVLRGREIFQAHREMMRLVRGDPVHSEGDSEAWIRSPGESVRQRAADRWGAATDLEITLLNGYNLRIYPELARLLERQDVHIEHYIFADGGSAWVIRLLNALMPVLFSKGYSGFIRFADKEAELGQVRALAAADAMLCRYRTPGGEAKEEMVVFHDPNEGIVLPLPEGAKEELMLRCVHSELYQSLKRTYFSKETFEDYIQYSEDYAELERGRAIWKIKPDIGVDYIPSDILIAAAREGPIPKDADFHKVLDALGKVYARRYQDSFTKRRVAHTVLKRSAMRRFARTGRLSDHFWGMRAFTLEERVRILKVLLQQQLENPYVHLYFLKEDDSVRDVEIACYEDLGILILQSDTDYNLASRHSEAMISHPVILNLFQRFFMEEMVGEYSLPESASIVILRELIAECEQLSQSKIGRLNPPPRILCGGRIDRFPGFRGGRNGRIREAKLKHGWPPHRQSELGG